MTKPTMMISGTDRLRNSSSNGSGSGNGNGSPEKTVGKTKKTIMSTLRPNGSRNNASNNNSTNRSKTSSTVLRRKKKVLGIESYIPHYLKRYVHPYSEEFCYCQTYHYQLLAQILVEGFLPIAQPNGLMLPKLHLERCVISLGPNNNELHVSKSIRKKSKHFRLTINNDFDTVVEQCRKQHGHRCWLYPPLVQVFKQVHTAGQVNAVLLPTTSTTSPPEIRKESAVRLYSIEVWNETTNEIVAGELGYSVGSIYTSLTGFSNQDSAGSVQLVALGRLLSALGFSIWDLGMDMDYKQQLGAHLMPRQEFVHHLHTVRETRSDLQLPITDTLLNQGGPWNCKALIDDATSTIQQQQQTDSNTATNTSSSKKINGKTNSAGKASSTKQSLAMAAQNSKESESKNKNLSSTTAEEEEGRHSPQSNSKTHERTTTPTSAVVVVVDETSTTSSKTTTTTTAVSEAAATSPHPAKKKRS